MYIKNVIMYVMCRAGDLEGVEAVIAAIVMSTAVLRKPFGLVASVTMGRVVVES